MSDRDMNNTKDQAKRIVAALPAWVFEEIVDVTVRLHRGPAVATFGTLFDFGDPTDIAQAELYIEAAVDPRTLLERAVMSCLGAEADRIVFVGRKEVFSVNMTKVQNMGVVDHPRFDPRRN